MKAIIFDFDGVILSSADLKTQAFSELFQHHEERVEEIIRYHKSNMGISRFVKFRHIYRNILKKELSVEQEHELGCRFSKNVYENILRTPFVDGALEFLERFSKEYFLFVASGTPEDELVDISNRRKIAQYFRELHGSPKEKHVIITDILQRYAIPPTEIVFVGDAESDLRAAERAGVKFIALIGNEPGSLNQCRWKIQNLHQLSNVLLQMDKE